MTKLAKETKAKIAKIAKAKAVETANRIEEIQLQNQLAYLESDKYISDTIKDTDNIILSSISDPLDAISDKHFIRYQEFNFGVQVNSLIGSIKTVMLQKKKGFEAIEDIKLTNPALMQFAILVSKECSELPEALGRNTYFDKLSMQVVPGETGNAKQVRDILETLCRKLSLTDINLNRISQERFNVIEANSAIKAQTKYEDNKLLDPVNAETNDNVVDFKTA